MTVKYDPVREAEAYMDYLDQSFERWRMTATCQDCAHCKMPEHYMKVVNEEEIGWCDALDEFVQYDYEVFDCSEAEAE